MNKGFPGTILTALIMTLSPPLSCVCKKMVIAYTLVAHGYTHAKFYGDQDINNQYSNIMIPQGLGPHGPACRLSKEHGFIQGFANARGLIATA